MADLKHGEVDLADCVEAKSFLLSTGYVDEEQIGITGFGHERAFLHGGRR